MLLMAATQHNSQAVRLQVGSALKSKPLPYFNFNVRHMLEPRHHG